MVGHKGKIKCCGKWICPCEKEVKVEAPVVKPKKSLFKKKE